MGHSLIVDVLIHQCRTVRSSRKFFNRARHSLIERRKRSVHGEEGATSTMVTETLEQWPHWGVNTSPLPRLAMDYNIWRHKAELEEEESSKVESTQEQGGEKEGSEIFRYRSEGGGEMARKRKIGRMTRDTCFAHYCVQVVWVKRSCPSASLSLNKHRA